MRRIAMLAAASGVLATTAISSVIAQSQGEQRMFTLQDIKWVGGAAFASGRSGGSPPLRRRR